jgi:hypothetical protein
MDERKTPRRARNPEAATGEWQLDPSEVRMHRRRLKEARSVGPLGKTLRVAAVALVLAGAALVYLNLDTLRGMTVRFPVLAELMGGEDAGPAPGGLFGGGSETAVVEAPSVVGEALPSSLDDAPAPNPAEAVEAPPPAEPDEAVAPAVASATPAPAEPPPAPEPELPVTPETFDFGLAVVSVSESDASATVLVLRNGGRRGVSSVSWWTTDGTATAGSDYASLGRQTLRFAAGEQNRSVRIPIIGDGNREGPESFFVHVAPGDSDQSVSDVEVIINDDD